MRTWITDETKVRKEKVGPCWISNQKRRYPSVSFYGSSESAHRAVYTLYIGEIPEGFHIDHLCGNTICYNPAHLEAVTVRENVRRSDNGELKKTHCPRGHSYSGDNLWVSSQGYRQCRKCWSVVRKERRRKLKLLDSRESLSS